MFMIDLVNFNEKDNKDGKVFIQHKLVHSGCILNVKKSTDLIYSIDTLCSFINAFAA